VIGIDIDWEEIQERKKNEKRIEHEKR